MPNEALETYLNDHLAGSVSAIELLERAVDEHRNSALGPQLADLLAAIREDQEVLRGLMTRLGYSEHSLKQAGAWLAEKIGRLKQLPDVRIADFGTRRRHGFLWQDWSVQAMIEGLA